ncbi:MAG: YggS family pyridoxal phosphate-dependent enzyme [Vicinamibacterales bacterium]
MSIADRLALVQARIAAAAQRSGRDPASITLVAVSKTFPFDAVREAAAAGQRDFGENRVQEALQKIAQPADTPLRWHLIGHLQTNKARKAAPAFACIHSVDSLELLRKLDEGASDRPPDAGPLELLVQVDLAGEDTKFGAPPAEAARMVRAPGSLTRARIVGLMLVPPWNEDPEQTRLWFVQLRTLRDRWLDDGVSPEALRHLSMGMSHDYEAAIEEGATIVRVGTAIFGTREAKAP